MEERYTLLTGDDLIWNCSELSGAGGFKMGEGNNTVLIHQTKPSDEIIENHRKLLGWIWIDA